jgi:hypothetical protein
MVKVRAGDLQQQTQQESQQVKTGKSVDQKN